MKVLHEPTAGTGRFAREAQALADLRHPTIVRYIHHGVTEEGEPFLVMQWLEGEDLAARLARGRLGVGDALRIARDVAEALVEAHAHGLVHRDLKPANLFLLGGRCEEVRLLDFGVAHLGGGPRATASGTIVGTPGYMSPEQARGLARITPAADVFGLGCVLFETLTGQPAFAGGHVMALLAKLIFEDAPRVAHRLAEVPSALDALVARMLAKDPAKRPPARAVAATLDELLAVAGVGPAPLRTRAAPASLTDGERRLHSLIVIGAGEQRPPLAEEETGSLTRSHAGLLAEVERAAGDVAGRVERLADGSLVIAMGGGGVATDRAARAGRFALRLRRLVPDLPIALASGRAEPGRPLGDTIDRVALRLASPSARGAIAVDPGTAALLDARFLVLEGPSGLELVGEQPLALDPRPLLGRLTPCVGRERELRLLEETLAASFEDASARVCLLTGPPGSGKSRLARELIHGAARRQRFDLWRARGEPARMVSSLGLLAPTMRAVLAVPEAASPEAQRDELRRSVGHVLGEHARVAELLGELAGVPFPDADSPRLRAARGDGQVLADQIQAALSEYVAARCAVEPLVLLLDDLQWSDAASVRVVDATLRACRDRPLFVLALARPEVRERFPALWSERAVFELRLGPLPPRACEQLVAEVLGERIDAAARARMVARADGNAFYLEEIIRATAEGHETTPDTVLAMVQSRLEGLEVEARAVLRAASVFGETFHPGGVRALLGESRERASGEWISLLVERELLMRSARSRLDREEELGFRHALLRDGAYSLLTEQDRIVGHRLAGEWLERHGERSAAVLADHFERGGANERAAHWHLQAAEHAFDINDHDAAMASASRGLVCGADGELRGGLLGVKAGVHMTREEWDDVVDAGREAAARLPPGGRRWARTYHHLFPAVAFTRPAELPEAMATFLRTPAEPDSTVEHLRALTWLAVTLVATGARQPAFAVLHRIEELYEPLDRRELAPRAYVGAAQGSFHRFMDERPWSCMLAYSDSAEALREAGMFMHGLLVGAAHATAVAELGEPERAVELLRELIALSERVHEPFGQAYAFTDLARILVGRADPAAQAEARELAARVTPGSNAILRGIARGVLAEGDLRRDELGAAEEGMRAACDELRPFPAYGWRETALLARVLLRRGKTGEALETAEAGLARMEELGMSSFGELLLRDVIADARAANGRRDGAAEMERAAARALLRRAADVADAEARARYLALPLHARILARAAEVGG
jgi:tetratricopeptide (TPR) repeat protein